MRKSSVARTFDDFFDWMNWYIGFLNKVFAAERVLKDQREKKEVLEAFVFKIHVTWEIFIEELLIDCLNRDTSQYANCMDFKLPKHLSRSQCKAMVTGLRYVDFRSVSEIKKGGARYPRTGEQSIQGHTKTGLR